MSLNNILKYRNVWMGLAIIWTVIYHSGITFHNSFLSALQHAGYGGVDIFFFASGLGCYYSFIKDSDIKRFLISRVKKLMPTYLLFMPFWLIFTHAIYNISPATVLGNLFCVQYFTGKEYAFNWYISALWLLYILTPYFVMMVDKANNLFKCLLITALLVIFSVAFWGSNILIIAVTRFPIFFLGMFFAKLNVSRTKLMTSQILILLISSVVGFVLLYYFNTVFTDKLWSCGLYWYPFILITPGLCFAISLGAAFLEKTNVGKLILKPISFIGNHTFEIYLVHVLLFEIYKNYFITNGILPSTTQYWLITIVLVIPCCVLLHFGVLGIQNLGKLIIKK